MISVVTPSFRQLDWLRLAIASVADQEGVESEHIVQDGGTDGIAESLRIHFGDLIADRRLQVFVEKDAGMYDAVNRGLRRARGEICAYLNCDEQYLPDALHTVEQFFDQHPTTDVLFGDAILVDAGGVPVSYRRAIRPTLAHLRLADLNTLTCATFFSRRLVQAGHLFPTHLKIAGDQLWIFELLKAGAKMAVLPRPLSIFTFTGSNLSQNEQAAAEKFGWLPGDERPRRWATPLVVGWHRLRKFRAGAYRRRNVEMDIYTRQNPQHRTRVAAQRVGFQWPSSPNA
ncbi:MAG: glycosyltransferase [Bryobacteraceae bacterium]